MITTKLLSAASGAVLALGIASSGFGPSPASAQGYGAPPPPPSYAPRPPSYDREHDRSVLKVCKVAGPGIRPGEPFAFFAKPEGGKVNVVIPAGPAPGGYCQILGIYPVGTQVDVREQIPNGYVIESITAVPSGAVVNQNLEQGRILVNLGAGITEITVINLPPDKGMVEICKEGGRRDALYTFSYVGSDGETHQIQVPAGACTPVIEVRSGAQVFAELNAAGEMSGGTAYPASRLVKADPARGQITVNIPRGGSIETQTIVTFKNREGRGNY
jgi:hypothetical protein